MRIQAITNNISPYKINKNNTQKPNLSLTKDVFFASTRIEDREMVSQQITQFVEDISTCIFGKNIVSFEEIRKSINKIAPDINVIEKTPEDYTLKVISKTRSVITEDRETQKADVRNYPPVLYIDPTTEDDGDKIILLKNIIMETLKHKLNCLGSDYDENAIIGNILRRYNPSQAQYISDELDRCYDMIETSIDGTMSQLQYESFPEDESKYKKIRNKCVKNAISNGFKTSPILLLTPGGKETKKLFSTKIKKELIARTAIINAFTYTYLNFINPNLPDDVDLEENPGLAGLMLGFEIQKYSKDFYQELLRQIN